MDLYHERRLGATLCQIRASTEIYSVSELLKASLQELQKESDNVFEYPKDRNGDDQIEHYLGHQ
jgi:hypothetical protein